MVILYIVESPPLIILILAHSDQVDMDFKFFFSHFGPCVVQLK